MKKGTFGALALIVIVLAVVGYIIFAKPSVSAAPTQEQTDTGALHDKVKVSAPESGATVGQSFAVTGEAPGTWYFEASFPIEVLDATGAVIAQTHADALSDWMTAEQVAFSATTTIATEYHGAATLVLHKDNPSGLPEHEDSIQIPIVIQ